MTEQKAPKIEFPCPNYPIKVIGRGTDDFKDMVISVVQKFAPELKPEQVTIQDSKTAIFQSVRFSIIATGEPQLKQLHEALIATGRVTLVL